MNTKTWERRDIKERAKVAFQRSYWWCVLAALILMFVVGESRATNVVFKSKEEKKGQWTKIERAVKEAQFELEEEDVQNYLGELFGGSKYLAGKAVYVALGGVILLILIVAVVVAIISACIKIFLINPLQVGGKKFFMECEMEKKNDISCFLDGFRGGNYGNVVVAMFVRDLKIFLWTLLFVIPGIVKAYEYRMVPYILAEHPTISYQEALDRSSKIMDGQKMNAFIFDLSFIGWAFLSAITSGIVGVFWSNPYYYAAAAELYLELSDESIVAGTR